MLGSNDELIRQKQGEKSGYECSKSEKESRVRNNNQKLNRMYSAKSILETQKGYAYERYRLIKAYAEDGNFPAGWTGNNARQTKSNFDNNVVPLYKTYINSIDECLDALCDEITRIENENNRLNGDIWSLVSIINSIANEIEKLFN